MPPFTQRFRVGSIDHYYTVDFTIVAEVYVFESHPSVRYEHSPFQLFDYYANLNTSRELVHESTRDFSVFILNPLESLSSCTLGVPCFLFAVSAGAPAIGMSWAFLSDEEMSEIVQR